MTTLTDHSRVIGATHRARHSYDRASCYAVNFKTSSIRWSSIQSFCSKRSSCSAIWLPLPTRN
jgi:hypothetical protein